MLSIKHLVLLHCILLVSRSSSSLQLVIDTPSPGQLFLLGDTIQFQTHLHHIPHDTDLTTLQLCLIHGDFPDTQFVSPSTTDTISSLSSTMQTQCFEPGLLTGIVELKQRGYHRFGLYLQHDQEETAPTLELAAPTKKVQSSLTSTFVQIIDYQLSNVTSSLWQSCTTCLPKGTAPQQCSSIPCIDQLVDIVLGPRKYNVTASAAKGYGIYVSKALIPIGVAQHIVQLAQACTFDLALDTIDQAPSVQLDLWHRNAGVPGPTTASLLLTAELFRSIMPVVLQMLNTFYPWEPRNMTCTDAFLRRYRPGERVGVKSHSDSSDITVNCILSSSETDFSGGFVYRFINEWSIDVIATMQGDCVFHPGQVMHGALPTEVGTRYTLITFWKVKERMEGSTSYEKVEVEPTAG